MPLTNTESFSSVSIDEENRKIEVIDLVSDDEISSADERRRNEKVSLQSENPTQKTQFKANKENQGVEGMVSANNILSSDRKRKREKVISQPETQKEKAAQAEVKEENQTIEVIDLVSDDEISPSDERKTNENTITQPKTQEKRGQQPQVKKEPRTNKAAEERYKVQVTKMIIRMEYEHSQYVAQITEQTRNATNELKEMKSEVERMERSIMRKTADTQLILSQVQSANSLIGIARKEAFVEYKQRVDDLVKFLKDHNIAIPKELQETTSPQVTMTVNKKVKKETFDQGDTKAEEPECVLID